MRLLVTTNARLYKAPNGLYYTPLVYGYEFFLRYLNIFEELRLVAHTESCSDDQAKKMLLVSGPRLEVYEMPFPHGKVEYIKSYNKIQRRVKLCLAGCDAALFRVPDQLAFQIFDSARRVMPVAVEVTSDPLELYSSKGGRYPLRLFIKWIQYFNLRSCCRNADCISYVTKKYLQEVYPSKITNRDRRFETHYTSAGIDSHEISEREYPINRTINLLHVSGSISGKIKGHKELIDAFISLREKNYDLNLTLVGSGRMDQDILSKLELSGEFKRVRFTGLLNREQLMEQYKRADIFVFPSYREGLPRVIIEAMSWGLPCISTNIPGCKELLSDNMLAKVGDSHSLLVVLKNLLDNPDLQRIESKRNIQESQKYSTGVIENKRNELYTHLKELASKR